MPEKNPLKVYAKFLHQTGDDTFRYINVGICANGYMLNEVSDSAEANLLTSQMAQTMCNEEELEQDLFPHIASTIHLQEAKPADTQSPYLYSLQGSCTSGGTINNPPSSERFRDFDFEGEEDAMDHAYMIGKDVDSACSLPSPATPKQAPYVGGAIKKS